MTGIILATFLVLGHIFTAEGKVAREGRVHYRLHSIYARLEPVVIHTADFFVSRRFFRENPIGRAILWMIGKSNALIPHGVVIPTSAAIRIVRDIEKHSDGQGHIAVGPCVCQRVLKRPREPLNKDMTIWYGAEIYRNLFPEEYREIDSDEAANLLRGFHEQGLAPVAEFCMQSRRWMFVICNCDAEVCCPTRLYNAAGVSLYPGPFLARQETAKCLGPKECGACLDRCHFQANRVEGDKVLLESKKCLGCGLCVTTCRGQARRLEKRPGYRGRLLPWELIKDAEPA